jgi:hypothetical protein
MRFLRNLRWAAIGAFFVLTACGQTPETTEEARGLLSGVNIVLALSVLFIVLALGIVAAAVATDRFFRSRSALEEGPPVDVSEEEEEDEIVAGIGVGRASVPRWLYAAYVLIPIFAMTYVVSNVAVAPAAPKETAAPAPTGPCTECTISAAQIKFSTDKLTVAAAEPVTVTFDNSDTGVPHTFTVYETEADFTGGGEKIADTGLINSGVERDVKFTGPAAGESLFFICTVHPPMKGTIEGA